MMGQTTLTEFKQLVKAIREIGDVIFKQLRIPEMAGRLACIVKNIGVRLFL